MPKERTILGLNYSFGICLMNVKETNAIFGFINLRDPGADAERLSQSTFPHHFNLGKLGVTNLRGREDLCCGGFLRMAKTQTLEGRWQCTSAHCTEANGDENSYMSSRQNRRCQYLVRSICLRATLFQLILGDLTFYSIKRDDRPELHSRFCRILRYIHTLQYYNTYWVKQCATAAFCLCCVHSLYGHCH